jgi:hypothetical protein
MAIRFREADAQERPLEERLEGARRALREALELLGSGRPKGKGGRPPKPGAIPWKERRLDHLRVYRREYMRGWRARKRASQGGVADE